MSIYEYILTSLSNDYSRIPKWGQSLYVPPTSEFRQIRLQFQVRQGIIYGVLFIR